MASPAPGHRWKFFRAGGVDQVVLATAADLANLHTLDQKLWVALACPVDGLEFDARTLALLDADGDGRIRPPDVLAAIGWLEEILVDLGDVFKPSDEVALASISDETEAGRNVRAGARLILQNLGKAAAKTITLADVSDTERIFASTRLNGDAIVVPESADDLDTSQAIADVMAIMGSVADRSGKPGVDQGRVDAFFEQARLYAEWHASGQTPVVRALGEGTGAAVAALDAVRAKIDDYFARCRLAAFDPRAAAALGASEPELAALSTLVLTSESDAIARLPLARIEPERALPLREGLNPAWAARMADFARATVAPLTPHLSSTSGVLTAQDWQIVTSLLAPYDAWLAAKPASDIAKLDEPRVLALARGDAHARTTALIAKDAALAAESSQIESVEKLVRFRRDLAALLENFVSFSAFYARRKAIFQVGTLYIDARSCDLCLPVHDAGRHALLASLSQAYLVYCDCVRRKDQEKRSILAAVTGGSTDNLMVGRNGVFYDRRGDDWDATITKIIENPISVRQAFWTPYKRFIRLVEEQFAKRARDADGESNKTLEVAAAGTAGTADNKPEAAAAEPPKPEAKRGIDVGTVAAIGVAIGGIATFFSSILATFLGLGMWMPFGLAAALLAISGPSMLLAYLKLRQRNLGPLLDANGWAVNAMASINVPFGGALTALPELPPGAYRSMIHDPYAEKRRPWWLYSAAAVLLLLAGAWLFGKLDTYLPDKAKASTVLHRTPPAEAPPAAPAK